MRFPGESAEYRAARDRLLDAEIELKRATEAVAQQRRDLPPGGLVPDGYVFHEAADPTQETRFEDLFSPGRDTLVVYGYMYGPDMAQPCPSCTSILDSLGGAALHLAERINLVAVAKSDAERIAAFAQARGWRHLRLLSSAGTTFNADYHAETPTGDQMPMLNVFRKGEDGIRHFWSCELLDAPPDPGQEERHVDFIWPIWNVLDATPDGRGEGQFPRLAYITD